ncbi:MAG TPA: tetratricopeptide repeat protein [Chitinophagaceae bacterium]|nr:tetratricopeptide repeat protein [Chitinophagaceae bacterium]
MQNISSEELELIESYLSGSLSAGELAIFEKRMEADALWREKVKEIQLLTAGIQESALQDALAHYHQPFQQKAPVVKMQWLKKAVAAAAVIVVLLAGTWWFLLRPSADEKLFSGHFRPDPGLPTTMGVSDNYIFDRAMVDYKTGDYRKAIAGWEQLLQQDPGNDTLNYFIGSALLADGEFEKSLSCFDTVIKSGGSAFLQEAHWYKALALIRIGRRPEAAALLQGTSRPEAQELIRKLQ